MKFFAALFLLLLCGCSVIPQDFTNELKRLNDNLEAYKSDVHQFAATAKKIEEHIKWIRREYLEKKDE